MRTCEAFACSILYIALGIHPLQSEERKVIARLPVSPSIQTQDLCHQELSEFCEPLQVELPSSAITGTLHKTRNFIHSLPSFS